jgi:probable rRNA maturation factor
VASDRVRVPISAARVRRIVATVLRAEGRAAEPPSRRADITITFVGPASMRRLNREWMGHDAETDVLSFNLRPPEGGVTGDVYICAAVARTQAREHGVPVAEELARLVVHGTLHALGYDHPVGSDRTRSAMWRRQERYVKALM